MATKKTGTVKKEKKKIIFNILAVVFISIHIVFFLLNWGNYPTELDTPYHLLMGKMFADNGRIMLWDSYEFAPAGRPHLYPPLLHILVWILRVVLKTSYMNIGRIIVFGQVVLGFVAMWYICRKLFNSAVALFALVFFASHTESWWWQTSVVPIAIITVLFLPFIYLFYNIFRIFT